MLRDVDDFLAGRIDRRDLLRGGAGLALGVGLAGCGVGDSGGGSKEDTEKVVKAKVDGDLVYFNWSEYLDPELIKDVREEVRRQGTPVELRLDGGECWRSSARATATTSSSRTSRSTPRLVASNQLLKLDHDQLKNYDQIFEFFHDPAYDPGSPRTPCPTGCTPQGSSGARTRSAA